MGTLSAEATAVAVAGRDRVAAASTRCHVRTLSPASSAACPCVSSRARRRALVAGPNFSKTSYDGNIAERMPGRSAVAARPVRAWCGPFLDTSRLSGQFATCVGNVFRWTIGLARSRGSLVPTSFSWFRNTHEREALAHTRRRRSGRRGCREGGQEEVATRSPGLRRRGLVRLEADRGRRHRCRSICEPRPALTLSTRSTRL